MLLEPGFCTGRIYFYKQVFLSLSKASGEVDYLEILETFGLIILLHSLTWLGYLIFCKILQFYFSVEI